MHGTITYRLYCFIETHFGCTRTQIAETLGLELTTVSRRVADLKNQGLVFEIGRRKCPWSGRQVGTLSVSGCNITGLGRRALRVRLYVYEKDDGTFDTKTVPEQGKQPVLTRDIKMYIPNKEEPPVLSAQRDGQGGDYVILN
jgi:hypothetical protein